jgi:hypothetical protein
VTEAFWAASFQPPTVPTMLAWLGARGAAALAARGFPVVKRLRNSVYLSGIVVGLLVVYSGVRVITSILPITAVRNALVGPLDRLLTGWSGDMHVLLFDPAQSADIRTRVREAMQAVANAGFPRVAVVAHSGGAVASYTTLTDDAAWPAPKPGQREPPSVVSYVTLGQGLNIAWRLCGVGDGASCEGAAGSGLRLTGDVRDHHASLRWHDYYSEGDTVAEARLAPPECLVGAGPAKGDEHSIENKPSNPHGGYWDNDEEFLLPVIETLVDAAAAQPGAPPQTVSSASTATPPADASGSDAPPAAPPDPRLTDRLLRIGMFSFTSRVLFGAMVSTIVASALFGGARMDDLGAWLASVATFIPANEIVTGPIGWLHEVSIQEDLGWARGIGTFVVTGLLLLAAAYSAIRLLPEKLAWGSRKEARSRWPIVLTDVVVGLLPPALVAVWLALLVVAWLGVIGGIRGFAPAPAVVSAASVLILLLAIGLLIFSRPDMSDPRIPRKMPAWASATIAAITLLVVGLGIFTVVMAVAANRPYGGAPLGMLVLGALVVWLLFKFLGGAANWRWDAWDGREREGFRQKKDVAEVRNPFGFEHGGRWWDLLVIGVVAIAAMALALGIGAPFLPDTAVSRAFIAAASLSVSIFVIGVAQDAYNSRAGTAPQEVTPLPSSAS